jgi:hypothetical protein
MSAAHRAVVAVFSAPDHPLEKRMTVCPIAIVAGCRKCPAFSICPLKTVLGDQVKEAERPAQPDAAKRKPGRKRAR